MRLARQAISLDPSFAAAYGVALACYNQRRDENRIKDDEVAEGKQYALRAIEVGADDAFALARAAHFFSTVLGDPGTADVIADQAIAVNPNLAEAQRIRGWTSIWLGQHERAIEQFHYAMRLNPLDPQIYYAEGGLALANFLLRRFEVALSWATKSLARQKYVPGQMHAMVSYAMLGRIADAQIVLARLREAGNISPTISQIRKKIAYWRQEDVELYIEARRIAGAPRMR